MSVRVRFAPSPTGYLHIGGARTALFNWLLARHVGGTFILRIEDTDEDRSTGEFEQAILREFHWLGIDWDEGPIVGGPHAPYRQTERRERYAAAAASLLAEGRAYRCVCSAERLDALRKEQMASGQNPGYDGLCRDLELGPDCGPHVIRLKAPRTGHTTVDDLIKGPVTYQNAELDDIILVRSDGMPTYNFVVVCDDAAMGMSHVIRGEEHLNNTPKQLLIYKALGVHPPKFAHVPLILALDGSKLSKRNGVTSVGAYRDMGILPEGLLNYLARLGWSHGDQEIFSKDELVAAFTLEGIGMSAGKWDMDKLLWVNAHWMRALPIERVAEPARPFFAAVGATPDERYYPAVQCMRERSRTLKDLAETGAFFFVADEAVNLDPAAVAQLLAPAVGLVGRVADLLEPLPEWTEPALEGAISAWVAQEGLKLGKVAQPVRVALCGQKVGPGLYTTLAVLGREISLRRLRNAAATVARAEQPATA